MKKSKIIAAVSAVALVLTSSVIPNVSAADSSSSDSVIISRNFEDGVMDFTGRDGYGTLSIVSGGHSSDSALCCSDRQKSWQGPQFQVDTVLETGVEYTVSAWVKAEWYNNITLSMEYTDSTGTRNYKNLNSAAYTGGDWVEIPETKFIIPENVTNVYLYFECGDSSNIYVDDFTIKSAPVYEIQQDIPSLQNVYANYFKFGGALMADELASPSTKNLFLKHYNSLTFGNELKPDFVLDQSATLAYMEANGGDDTNPQVNIDKARTLLDFAQENNIPVRGHVLVWHSQTPDWFFKEGFSDENDWVSEEVMLKRMENYIKNLMETLETEYPDVEFYAWDVVNEIWLDDGSPRTAGSSKSENPDYSAWVKIFGDNSFVDYAFEYARKYAPEGCKLYYNDFNEYMPSKTAAIVDMAERLKEKGLIDGIGMQSHLDTGFPTASTYEKALAAFAATGLDIQITELDITTSDTSEAGLDTQAKMYSDIMDLAVKYSDSISAVVLWGTTDATSWRAAKLPLLFNADYTAKPAYYSIIDGIDYDEPVVTTTSEEVTTTSEEVTTSEDVTTSPEETSFPEETTTTTAVDTTTTSETTTILIDPSLEGDTNLDGKVNISDLVVLKKHLLGSEEISADSPAFANADMNKDEKVNVIDLVALKNVLLS